MTDPNHVNGGPDGWPQQAQPPHPYDPQHPYAQQQAYAPEPYAQQGHAAQPYAPGQGHAPGPGQYAQPQQYPQQQPYAQPQHAQQQYAPQSPYAQQPPYGAPVADDGATTLLPPVPAVDDAAAATTLLPPVPAMDDAAATTLLPPVVVSGAVPAAGPGTFPAPAPAQAPAPAPGPVLDQPTMTLKRPAAPAAPYAAVPAQPAPSGMPGMPGMPGTPGPAAAAPAGPPVRTPRTGSPIIDPGLQPALITAGAAALLAGGAALGQVALALVVVLLQGLTAAGWFRLNGMWPARQGIALAALAGFTADAAVLLADADSGAAAVIGTLGGFFLLVLVLQTFRPSDPKERFYALTVLGSATVMTVLCTALLLADWVPAAVGAVALATVLAAAPLPGPKQLRPVLGLAAAVVFGLVVGAPLALGALAGLGALVGRRVAAYDFPSRFVHMTAGVALPLAVASPLVWIATRLLAG
ncbi:hypothetical protein [Kitasatospora sp. NPDC047058]|uniref:hypothetical protein n=1 Tax=Kitasatospora sp. NPDC047058 TaxID=3155620 RepID=UPI003400C715